MKAEEENAVPPSLYRGGPQRQWRRVGDQKKEKKKKIKESGVGDEKGEVRP